jgi:hypothetical protein
MQKTWKPTTAGILSIVAGAIGLIGGIVIATGGAFAGGLMAQLGVPFMQQLIGGIAALLIVLGIVAIVGGVYALKRKVWGLSLAGTICAFLSPPLGFLGLLAIIFVVLGKDEF